MEAEIVSRPKDNPAWGSLGKWAVQAVLRAFRRATQLTIRFLWRSCDMLTGGETVALLASVIGGKRWPDDLTVIWRGLPIGRRPLLPF